MVKNLNFNLKKEMKDLFYMHINNKFLEIFLEIELLELFITRRKILFKMENTLCFLSGTTLYPCTEIAEIEV